MRSLPVRFPLVLTLLALAGCGDDPAGTEAGLTREEVGGFYNICDLTFTPTGLRPVNVIAAIAEPDPRPEFNLSRQEDTFELFFRRRGDTTRQLIQGPYERGATTVTVNFPDEANVASLLLPDPLRLEFSGRVLTAAPSDSYRVPKERYAAMAGYTAEETVNWQSQLEGRLTARFAVGACS